jgi:predicted dehydrogenase
MGDPLQVQAQAATLQRDIEVEDTLVVLLHFANGAKATITATTTAAPGFPHRLEIYGTKGGIQIEGETVMRWSLADPAQAAVPPQVSSKTADPGAGGDPRGIAASGHIALVRDFIAALRDNRPPLVDGREGMRSLATVLQIYQAANL